MKVIQVNAVNGILSTGRNCAEISEYLNKNGHECITAYSTGIATDNSYKISNRIECKLHGLFSRIFGLQGYFSYFSTGKLITLIKRNQPDIVHLNNIHANYINLNMLLHYLAKNNIATVITLHDCWIYTGKCTHYTIIGCNKWQSGCYDCPKLKNDHESWFFDRTKKMWNDKNKCFNSIPRLGVIGVSNWITHEAKKSFLSTAKSITTIYNWIDLEKFYPADTTKLREKSEFNGKFIVLGVSSLWGNNKGLDKFIELSQHLESDEVIILVGKVSGVKLPQNIIHIDATQDIDELVSYYSLADVFMQLSQEESFGKVSAEALACGTPIITNTMTANPELVGSDCGIALENYNIENLISAKNTVKNNSKSFYSEKCRQFAKENFSKDKNIEKHISFYNEVIN